MPVAIEDLKRSIDLVELFGSYGIEVKKRGAQHECCCPFHAGDDTPSLKITPDKGLWNCFGCDAGVSAVDLVMKLDGLDVAEARKKLLRRVPHIAPLSTMAVKKNEDAARQGGDGAPKECPKGEEHRAPFGRGDEQTRAAPDQSLLNAIFDRAHKTLTKPSCEGLAYLKTRGLDDAETIRTFKLGFIDGKALKVYDSVIVCEAIFDALALYSVGIKNVIATYGTNGWTEDHDALLSEGKARRLLKQPDLNTVSGFRDRTMLEVLYSCGLRISELRQLKEASGQRAPSGPMASS